MPGREDHERRRRTPARAATTQKRTFERRDRAPALDLRAGAAPLAAVVPLDRAWIERRRASSGAPGVRARLCHTRIVGNISSYDGRRGPAAARRDARRAAAEVAASGDLRAALAAIAAPPAEATDADLAVLRVLDAGRAARRPRASRPRARRSAAEVAGTRADCERVIAGEAAGADRGARPSAPGRPACSSSPRAQAGASSARSSSSGSATDFADDDRAIAELVAAQLALAVRTLAPDTGIGGERAAAEWLELAGEALAAGGDARRAGAAGACASRSRRPARRGGALWRVDAATARRSCSPRSARSSAARPRGGRARARRGRRRGGRRRSSTTRRCRGAPRTSSRSRSASRRSRRCSSSTREDAVPRGERAARARRLRGARRARAPRPASTRVGLELELERTRALLEVVGEAIARLSLAHTLETAVERIAELLQVEQVGVYLREEGRLVAAAGRGLAERPRGDRGAAARRARRPAARARARSHAHAARHRPGARSGARGARALRARTRPSPSRCTSATSRSACSSPIPARPAIGESDLALLTALAAQLAVAVQNARLHERATELGEALGDVLDVRAADLAPGERALRDLALVRTDPLARHDARRPSPTTIVDVLGVDAAVIRVPDERGDQFVPRAVHVAETRLADAVRTILERPQPRPPRSLAPLVLDVADRATPRRRARAARAVPREGLDRRAAADRDADRAARRADDPLARSRGADRRARRSRPPRTIAQQAALAIDNARLYQQQKEFAETMQQSLLPARAACGARARGRQRSTSRRRRSTSAATSTTSWSSPTAASRSCSAT